MTSERKIRILIADDHPVVRDGLSSMLGTQPDFEVIAEAADGQQAIDKIAALLPDVVLLDLEMPRLDGVAVLQSLKARKIEPAVLVFTAYDTDERILEAVRAGARGYLLKGVPREQLFEAIRSVDAGNSLLQLVVARKLMQQVQAESTRDSLPKKLLTERETEILKELAQGKTNREIAEGFFITERTVKFHVSAILRKLEVANRTEAVHTAVQLGLIDW